LLQKPRKKLWLRIFFLVPRQGGCYGPKEWSHAKNGPQEHDFCNGGKVMCNNSATFTKPTLNHSSSGNF